MIVPKRRISVVHSRYSRMVYVTRRNLFSNCFKREQYSNFVFQVYDIQIIVC